jgi:hypothetical protein
MHHRVDGGGRDVDVDLKWVAGTLSLIFMPVITVLIVSAVPSSAGYPPFEMELVLCTFSARSKSYWSYVYRARVLAYLDTFLHNP